MENQISFTLSAEEQNQVDQAMDALRTVLEPKLISLLPQVLSTKPEKLVFVNA
ncbi:hypothetical protein QUH73_07805 [Labilibaculum sp. K2S]|uniref:hypothetical protein n=1 Tax=Labilibaculum sp. K2S TaxID=3056386 RepID=UPI0025A31E81|nr:hypothetical protein [Labilibaculum sp. K2S]MDM8159713.1 hypothetical protein [Labilibaculum sp. K2S]